MKFHLPKSKESSRPGLILLFAGWGMSEQPLSHVGMDSYDIAIVWDYRDMEAPWVDELLRYNEIIVVAWSFGVNAAARFMDSNPGLPVTTRIAVNGTRFTANDTYGIPTAIFGATLSGLCERSVTKFNMRMCGGASAYKEFAVHAPQRDVDNLREELESFANVPEAPMLIWDKAFVSKGDLIIPPTNQLKAWKNEAIQTFEIDGPHLPDFNKILRFALTDKSRVKSRFVKTRSTYDANSTIQRKTASHLVALTESHIATSARPLDILEIGCGTGTLSRMILERLNPASLTLWDLDIAPEIDDLTRRYPATAISSESCDAEISAMRLVDGGVYDLIISASTVQWFNSMRTFLHEAAGALRSGGLLALSTYGPDTMKEIHSALSTKSRFADTTHILRMLPENLLLVEMTELNETVTFDSPHEVLRHISNTGVNGLTHGNVADTRRLLDNYPVSSDSKATLTYNPIIIILRKQ